MYITHIKFNIYDCKYNNNKNDLVNAQDWLVSLSSFKNDLVKKTKCDIIYTSSYSLSKVSIV